MVESNAITRTAPSRVSSSAQPWRPGSVDGGMVIRSFSCLSHVGDLGTVVVFEHPAVPLVLRGVSLPLP
jgi:hypothetical protein